MNAERSVATVSALLSSASLVISLLEYEGIMAVTSLFALSFGCIAFKRCSPRANHFLLISAMATLLCTILSVTVFSQESLVDSGSMEKVTWFYLMALVHVVPLLPMTFASFFVIASITGASYNWAVVRGLTPFISMGMLVPGYVTEYFFQDINLDVWMVDNGYILYGLLVTLGITLVLSWLVSRRMRESHKIINEHGLVVLE